MNTPEENQVKSAAIARAWEDPKFRARLLANPAEALKELGAELAPGSSLRVVVDTPEKHHWVIPTPPPDSLQEDDLDDVAGGARTFLPEVDDEALLGFSSSDTRGPVIIGGLWNGADKPPSKG